MQLDEANEGLLPLISAASFGPPEKAFGHEITNQASVSIKNKQFVYFPWMLGTLYYEQGFEEFKNLLLNVLDYIAPEHNAFTSNAPGCVEMFFDKIDDNQYLFQMINLSGSNGTSVSKALPIYDIEIDFKEIAPKEISELAQDEVISVKPDGRKLAVDRLLDYKAYVIEV